MCFFVEYPIIWYNYTLLIVYVHNDVLIRISMYNNNNNISLLQTHGPYTYKKKCLNSNKNNNNIISQSKIVLINITLISTIAEWESEYKQ